MYSWLAISLILVFVRCASGQHEIQKPIQWSTLEDDYDPLDDEFEALVSRTLKHFHVPGLAVAVIYGNKTYSKGYGYATLPDISATPETMFYTGSTTKSFTNAALTVLMDESINSSRPISWKTPLSSIIRDDFVLQDEYVTEHATFEDAASHRTGLPRHDQSYGGPGTTVQDVIRKLRFLPLTAEFRTTFQYCNLMYVAITHAIETLTGRWLGDVLKDKIWAPLGMNSTFFDLQNATASGSHLARGYEWDEPTSRYVSEEYMIMPEVGGAGIMISTVLDYAKYLRAMINRAGPISEDGHTELRKPRSFEAPIPGKPWSGPSSYTLGWSIDAYRGEHIYQHNGGLIGFGAQMAYIPDRKWGIAMFANTRATSNSAEQVLFFHLLDELINTPKEERFDWVEKYDKLTKEERQAIEQARKRIYPSAPKKSLPLSLPLESYQGSYSHPAYQELTFVLEKPHDQIPMSSTTEKVLHAEAAHRTWRQRLELEHVSGEYFLAWNWFMHNDSSLVPILDVKAAEFKIGTDGRVSELGIAMEPSMGTEKIWYKKIS